MTATVIYKWVTGPHSEMCHVILTFAFLSCLTSSGVSCANFMPGCVNFHALLFLPADSFDSASVSNVEWIYEDGPGVHDLTCSNQEDHLWILITNYFNL